MDTSFHIEMVKSATENASGFRGMFPEKILSWLMQSGAFWCIILIRFSLVLKKYYYLRGAVQGVQTPHRNFQIFFEKWRKRGRKKKKIKEEMGGEGGLIVNIFFGSEIFWVWFRYFQGGWDIIEGLRNFRGGGEKFSGGGRLRNVPGGWEIFGRGSWDYFAPLPPKILVFYRYS